ncbi:MAG: glycoside hydrolase [Oscillospiraceae bacterium]|nr:glycoside hydrolase [Oscillospiraceae bacterium]
MKKIKPLLTAMAMAVAAIPVPFNAVAAGSYDMNVSVNLSGEKKEISPYIYGMNQYGNINNYKNVTVNAVRQGGNRYTGYNWETNWSNAGEDWVNSSDTNIGDDKDGAGYAARKLSEECQTYNVPYKITTLQMAGYVAADKAGTVTEAEKAPSARWNEVVFRKDGELSLTPDLTDGKVYMDEYVNFLVQTLGDASTATGIQGYSLDNEPFLWNDTHPMLHGEEAGCNELIDKSIELAKVVKEIDPKAETFGGVLWGMLPCITAGSGETVDQEWEAIKSNYGWYVDYYLESMAKAEQETGTRLLDVFDVHYYAQDCATDEARLQAARSLYDPEYVENSWLQPWNGQYFPFLTRLQESITEYYPGTKLAVSEYNLADIANEKVPGKSVVEAIAETDALVAFALNDVYFATYWGTLPDCPYVESAINLYTNYDGEGAAFGDTLVESKTEDLSKAASFAAIQGDDDSEVTVVLSNKDSSNTEKAVIDISGSNSDYQSAVVYAITQDSNEIRIIDVQNDLSGNQIQVELPPLSVAQIVISDEPTDKTLYEAPDIRTEEKSYDFSELEDKDGAKIIPLGDKAHLKEIKITVESHSTEGSAYYSGGGGLCFNALTSADGGDPFWGCKNYSYSNGVTEIVIPFDNEFTNGDSETVQAVVGDDTAELQTGWWVFSEKEGDAGSDVVVDYQKVTLVYEYDGTNTDDTTEPTTEPTAPDLTERLWGDADENGKVEILDVVLMNRVYVGVDKISDSGKKNADTDQDSKITLSDSMNVLKLLVHLLEQKDFPIAAES